MRMLVMGGTQFNGLALVHELARCGHDVTIVNRGRTEAPLPDGIHRLFADRTDHDQMRDVLGGLEFDVVLDMSAYHPDDVRLMVELFDGRTGQYVFASSTVVYAASDHLPITEDHPTERGDSQIEYGGNKLLCEDVLDEARDDHSFPSTVVYFSMVYGPRNIIPDREQRMFARLEAGRPVLIPGDGTTVFQVGHVDDQARALEATTRAPATVGRRYNITGKHFQSDLGYVATTAAHIGVEPDLRFIPADTMDALWDGDLEVEVESASKANIDIRTSPEARRRQQSVRHRFRFATVVPRLAPNIHRWNRSVVFGIDALRRDTDWEPRHDLASMVAQTHAWHVQTGGREYDWAYEDELLKLLG
ncbi:MAG: NAD-dependent epimerase/dehydratase family protein [Acidimicrobiales bacterium]|nr:NAD-dependent epimerase/dehydratase family protein [Acidimicrobiales bacterium]